MPLPPGTLVDDKYEIVSLLGEGGFGAVYSARQPNLDRVVALKIVHGHEGLEGESLARFEREAQTLAKLHHKNLALFYGYGIWQGAPYMVLEFVRGVSLQSVISESGGLKESRAVNICKQVCDALTCIHTNNIVHRDLKPANIMLIASADGTETVKLIDFGLAKVVPGVGERAQRLTEAGTTVGSSEYMSPEQCLGHELDGRADIYALGCVLQACLTGSAPFNGEHCVVIMQQHMYDAPPQLADLLTPGTYSEALQLVLNQALAKSPDDRYESAADFRADLSKVSGHDTTKLKAASATRPAAMQSAQRKKRGGTLVLACVAASVLSGICFWHYYSEHTHRNTGTADGDARPESSRYLFRTARTEESNNDRSTDEIIEHYKAALAATEKDHLLTAQERAHAAQRLSCAFADREQFAEAKPYVVAAMRDQLKEGQISSDYVKLTIEVDRILCQLKEYDLAISLLQQADAQFKKKIGKRDEVIMMMLAQALIYKGDPAGLELVKQIEKEDLITPDDKYYRDFMELKKSAEQVFWRGSKT